MGNNDGSSNQTSSGFWTTLPGVLTGLAGVIGAITALIVGLKEAGLIGQNTTPSSSPSPSVTSTPSPAPVSSDNQPSPTPEPSQPVSSAPSPANPRWEMMGSTAQGEGVYVDSSTIKKSGETINFVYKIGNDLVTASADCNANRWYATGYGWYSPQSKATQDMVNYVCKF